MNRTFAVLAVLGLGLAGFPYGDALAQDWSEQAVRYETEHPYPDGVSERLFAIRRPGATEMRVFFDRIDLERGWDFIDLVDRSGRRVQRLTGSRTRFWSAPVPGDTIEARLRSDRAGNGYGALITRLAFRGGAPIPADFERIEVLYEGRPLGPEDEIQLRAGGEAILELRLYDPTGREVPAGSISPGFRTGGDLEAPLEFEPLSGNRVRIGAGAEESPAIPVEIFDEDRPEISAKFLVTILPASTIERVEFRYRHRAVREDDVVTLSIRGTVELDVLAFDRSGRHLLEYDFVPEIGSPRHGAPVAVEGLEGDRIRLVAGDRPGDRVPIEIRDQHQPELSVRFLVTVESPSRVSEIRFLVTEGRSERVASGGEILRLTTAGGPFDEFRFRIQALDRNGRVLDPRDARLAVRLDGSPDDGTLEEIGGGRFVFRSGELARGAIEIRVEDPLNRRTRASLFVETVRAEGPPHIVHEIEFVIPEAEGGERPVPPGQAIVLALHGGGTDHLPLRIVPRDHGGRVVPWGEADLEVGLNVVGWYGTLEEIGGGEFVFHSGVLPRESIQVVARSEDGLVHAALPIAVRPPAPGARHAEPERPLAWGQIGATWGNPDWAKMKHHFDVSFENDRNYSIIARVKLVPRHPFDVEFVRLEYEDGTSQEVLTGRTNVGAGQELVLDVPPELQAKKLRRILARVRHEGYGEMLAYALTPQ